MANPPISAAALIYPHLPSADPEPVQQRPGGSIADAVYPHLKPQLKLPARAPRPQRTPEEVAEERARFWANVDPAWAASIGLVKIKRR